MEEIPQRKGMDHRAVASAAGGVRVLEGESYSTPGEHILLSSNPQLTNQRVTLEKWSGVRRRELIGSLVSSVTVPTDCERAFMSAGGFWQDLLTNIELCDLKCSVSNGAQVKC
jgi:hypothetical protein